MERPGVARHDIDEGKERGVDGRDEDGGEAKVLA